MEDFVGAKFYCQHALAHGNQHISIREKTLEFSSMVLPAPSLYLTQVSIVMAALRNRASHYMVALLFLSSFFLT